MVSHHYQKPMPQLNRELALPRKANCYQNRELALPRKANCYQGRVSSRSRNKQCLFPTFSQCKVVLKEEVLWLERKQREQCRHMKGKTRERGFLIHSHKCSFSSSRRASSLLTHCSHCIVARNTYRSSLNLWLASLIIQLSP